MTAAPQLRPGTLPIAPRDLARVLDQLTLAEVVRSLNVPARRCPRATCAASIFVAGDGWACTRCGALGGPTAFYLSVITGWTFDQLHDALEARHG